MMKIILKNPQEFIKKFGLEKNAIIIKIVTTEIS